MIIQRGLLHSLKLRKLEAVSGNPAAIKWLIALWGYCEQNKACTRFPGMSPDRFASACDEPLVEGTKLLKFLVESRWVELDGKTVIVRKFEAYNSGLFQRHEAAEKSARIRAERAGKTYIPPAERPSSDRSAPGQASVKRPSSDRRAMNEGMNERTREARGKTAPVGPFAGNIEGTQNQNEIVALLIRFYSGDKLSDTEKDRLYKNKLDAQKTGRHVFSKSDLAAQTLANKFNANSDQSDPRINPHPKLAILPTTSKNSA